MKPPKRYKAPLLKSKAAPKQLKMDFHVNTISNYIKKREEVFAGEGK